MRTIRAVLFVIILTVAALALAACGSSGTSTSSGPTEVHVTLTEFSATLDKTNIPAGPVKFIIDNAGALTHELVLEPAGIDDEPFEADGKKSEVEDITPGKETTLEWTVGQAGKYQLACHVVEGKVDHYAHGMIAEFTVTAV